MGCALVRSLTSGLSCLRVEGAQPEPGAKPKLKKHRSGEAEPSPHIGRQSRVNQRQSGVKSFLAKEKVANLHAEDAEPQRAQSARERTVAENAEDTQRVEQLQVIRDAIRAHH